MGSNEDSSQGLGRRLSSVSGVGLGRGGTAERWFSLTYQLAGCCQPTQGHIKGLKVRLPDSVFFIDKR